MSTDFDPTISRWDEVRTQLHQEINLRNYSSKTLKAYDLWVIKFQRFLRGKMPAEISEGDGQKYLSYLSSKSNISASSKKQASHALLFLFRYVLQKEFCRYRDFSEAEMKERIPEILSRNEIDQIFKLMGHPNSLIAKLLYGCGLRLFECLELRVHNFNFDAGTLTVYNNKERNERILPLPQSIMPNLLTQFKTIENLYKQDLSAGFGGACENVSFEADPISAAKKLANQWFFPHPSLKSLRETGILARPHLHESVFLKELKDVIRCLKLTKQVTPYTFRHSFAVHLLQANYDIHVVQRLLGHKNIKNTMIYAHCVRNQTIEEEKSPLDFPSKPKHQKEHRIFN